MALINQISDLFNLLQLDPDSVKDACVDDRFPLRVPMSFVERMHKGDRYDPLLLQVLPTKNEKEQVLGFSHDPVDDSAFSPTPGVIHKYRTRVLLIATQTCFVHCRYCFRREFPYEEAALLSDDFLARAMAYIESKPEIDEVILSGGDPLTLPVKKLSMLLDHVEAIPTVKRLRIHTRQAIVDPDRISEELIQVFDQRRLNFIFVVHANHPQELNDDVGAAIQRIKQVADTVLNQSVLLKGVNDSVGVLKDLSLTLFAYGILPYYINALDRVSGSHHFNVELNEGLSLIAALKAELPGYLMPKFVQDQKNSISKVVLA